MRSKWLKRLLLVLGGLVALYLILALLAKPAPDHPIFIVNPPRPLIIAHQGGDGLWPGNTMYAFERAVEMGADVLEMDMHSTADGVLVLMHDQTVERTTDGTGYLKEMLWADVQKLDAGYDWSPDGGQTFPYRGQGIIVPALEELFQRFPTMPMNIEIKQVQSPVVVEAFCQLIRQHEMQEKVLVASFWPEHMENFRQNCPEVATSFYEDEVRLFFGLNLAFLAGIYSPPAMALQLPEYSGSIHLLTPPLVQGAHGRNLSVHPWTINEVADMQRMLDLGVDGIITDYPDRLLGLLQP